MRLLLTRLWLLFLYCVPVLLALVGLSFENYRRVNDVAHKYAIEICRQHNIPDKSVEDAIPEHLQKFIKKTKECCGCEQAVTQANIHAVFANIWPRFYQWWRGNTLFVYVMTLLPFLILGYGLAFKPDVFPGGLTVENLKRSVAIALRDWPLKVIVAMAIVWGWLYTLNPFGWAGSAVNSWLKYEEIQSIDTAPIIFDLSKSNLKHFIAAFLGWYLYMLGYFLYRYYKGDVMGTRIYGVLLRRFIFVIGITIIISSVSGKETLILVFLLAIFPLSAVSVLVEYGAKSLNTGEEQASLSLLPGISTWQMLRLEEEGIDSIASLAGADLTSLRDVISSEVINPDILFTWVGIARLITVLGSKKWKEIRGVCLTADTFVDKTAKNDADFKARLSGHQIFNVDEIAEILRVSFSIKPRNSPLLDSPPNQ